MAVAGSDPSCTEEVSTPNFRNMSISISEHLNKTRTDFSKSGSLKSLCPLVEKSAAVVRCTVTATEVGPVFDL